MRAALAQAGTHRHILALGGSRLVVRRDVELSGEVHRTSSNRDGRRTKLIPRAG
jgi:hypothetical protein